MKLPEKKVAEKRVVQQFANGDELCKFVAEKSGGKCILAFSCGKDSIASWLRLRKYFDDILPYYGYVIPGLGFVEESLRYYENFFGRHIYRLPHPSLSRLLQYRVLQPPGRIAKLKELNYPMFEDKHLLQLIKEGAPEYADSLCAVGLKMHDATYRRLAIKQHGAVNFNTQKFYPIYDYTDVDVRRELSLVKARLPKEYAWFGRSFDGLQSMYLDEIKKHAPADYDTILEWFPLASMDTFRWDMVKKYEEGLENG
jgi:hypothetical protein